MNQNIVLDIWADSIPNLACSFLKRLKPSLPFVPTRKIFSRRVSIFFSYDLPRLRLQMVCLSLAQARLDCLMREASFEVPRGTEGSFHACITRSQILFELIPVPSWLIIQFALEVLEARVGFRRDSMRPSMQILIFSFSVYSIVIYYYIIEYILFNCVE